MREFFIYAMILSLGLCIESHAQDTIVTIKKKQIPSKVIEINRKDVIYEKPADTTGRLYKIAKHDVIKIMYANGVTDTFNYRLARIPEPVKIPPPPDADPRATDYFRNYVWMSGTDLVAGLITIGFERTLKSGKSSLVVPLSIGISNLGITKTKYGKESIYSPVFPTGPYYNPNKIYSSGLELNYYPRGQGSVKYYWGPSVSFGLMEYFVYNTVEGSPGNFIPQRRKCPIVHLMLKNGVLIQATKKFNMTFFAAIGTPNLAAKPGSESVDDHYYTNTTLGYFTIEAGIHAGYKF